MSAALPPNMVLKLSPRPGVPHIAQGLRRPRRSLKPIRYAAGLSEMKEPRCLN